MFSKDFAGGLVSVSIGCIYLYFSFELRSSPLSDTVGPAGSPKLLGVLMVCLGLMLCIQSLYKFFKLRISEDEWHGQAKVMLRAFGMLSMGVVYLLIVKTLGYLLSIMLLIYIVALYQGVRPGWRVAAISMGGAVMLWAIFVLLLGVSMPSGIFKLS